MVESVLLIVLGLVFLLVGGEFLVRAASRIASLFGVSPLVIGLTIVAYGTSAPELGVSLFSAMQGDPEIALANVVGSNIFNIGFILGLCAMISPLGVSLQLIKFDVPILVGISFITYLMSLNGQITRSEGFFLFLGSLLYTLWLIRASKREPEGSRSDRTSGVVSKRAGQALGQIGIGIICLGLLVGGSKLLVEGAVDLARLIGISETLIGLTIVAAGTSLPEVATSTMATVRGEKDIAVGNIIGSNIFNIMLILGLSAGINRGLVVEPALLKVDLLVMMGVTILCFPLIMSGRKLSAWEGMVLFSTYTAYVFLLVYRG